MFPSFLEFIFYFFFLACAVRFWWKNWFFPGQLYDEIAMILFNIPLLWAVLRFLDILPILEISLYTLVTSSPFLMLARSLSIIVIIILSVAIFTLVERKILGSIQLRLGPNVVGPWGLFQPFADAIKLIFKETVLPVRSNVFLFLLAPSISFSLSLSSWSVIPVSFTGGLVNLESSLFFIIALSSLNSFVLLLAGWSSNSRYSFLGSIRTAAQLISYEISLISTLLSPAVLASSYNLDRIAKLQFEQTWYIFPLFGSFIIFIILMLAETNRAPFDLPEAEAELVSGYNTEYSSASFALFFLAEYSNMLLLSALGVTVFLGGPYPPGFLIWLFNPYFLTLSLPFIFASKLSLFIFFYIWVRGSLPRYRYDQLMSAGWKIFLPLSFSNLLFSFLLVRLSFF